VTAVVTAGVTIVIDASGEAGPMQSTLRHEAAHAFVIGYLKKESNRLPWWLNEGIAQLAAAEGVAPPDTLESAVKEGRLVSLSDLDSMQVTLRPEEIATAYAEGASATRYLIETHGDASLGNILRHLAAGEPLPEAFESATGTPLADFERAWLADIRSTIAARRLHTSLAIAAVFLVVALELCLLVRARRKARRSRTEPDSATAEEGAN
jgi:hypothetical protein